MRIDKAKFGSGRKKSKKIGREETIEETSTSGGSSTWTIIFLGRSLAPCTPLLASNPKAMGARDTIKDEKGKNGGKREDRKAGSTKRAEGLADVHYTTTQGEKTKEH